MNEYADHQPKPLAACPRRAERTRIHGCKTTHIFCLPTCHYDRRVLDRNRVVFASIAEAEAAGFRPCKVCKPAV